jgi:nucleotide-binding universal stress UspA family protein
MFRLRSLAVIVLLAVSSLLTLKLMGLSQWIQAILVIGVELLLGVLLHEIVDGRGRRAASLPRHRPGHRPGQPSHRRKHPSSHSNPGGSRGSAVGEAEAYVPSCRLLLPVRDDRPALVDYALRECRSHRAELDLLFLRVMTVMPMGPVPPLSEADDDEARGVIERARRRAEAAGVPFRAIYAATHNPPATILEQAGDREADLVLMSASRRGRGGLVSKMLVRDDVRDVLKALPDHIGLLVHA